MMNTWIKGLVVLALVAAIGVLGVGAVSAQGDEPPVGPWGPMYAGDGPGLLAAYDDIMHQALADALGISLAEFEAARDDGIRLPELAEANDVELEELWQVMDEARTEAIEQALADGAITEEQAEWLAERGMGMRFGGMGRGACDGSGPLGEGPVGPRGGRGPGRGASTG
jgi:hypothetical protein